MSTTAVVSTSSASESKTAGRRCPQVRQPVLIVVAVLVVAELVLRLTGPHLPPNQVWAAAEDQVKVEQMRTLVGRHQSNGLVFVGTSLTDVGIDPSQFTQLAGLRGPSYDASLAGGDLGVIAWWTTHVVVPILHPRMLVLGVSSREFNPNDPQASVLNRQFFSAPSVHHIAGKESTFEALERKADDWSYLFRYRKVVRVPSNLTGSTKNPINLEKKFQTPLGMQLNFVAAPYAQGFGVDSFFRTTVTKDYVVGPAQLSILRSLLAELNGDGIAVALVDMPVTQHFIDLHPHGPADYASYRRELAGVAREAGVPLTGGQVWDQERFADPIHLNGLGAEQLTKELASELQPSLPTGLRLSHQP